MKKKDVAFFSWLNNAIFWKNFQLMKTDYNTKRVIMAVKHGVKQNGLTRGVVDKKQRKSMMRGSK